MRETTAVPGTDSGPGPRLAIHAAVGMLLITLVVLGGVLVVGLTTPYLQGRVLPVLAGALCLHGLMLLGLEFFLVRRHHVSWRSLGAGAPVRNPLHLLWQVPACLLLLLGVQGAVLALMGENGGEGGSATTFGGAGPVTVVLGLVATVVLTPLWEEVFFRGILYGTVRRRWSVAPTVAVTAVVFTAVHGVPILIPYLLTLGVLLAVLRTWYSSLWPPLVLHMTVNALASTALVMTLV